MIPEGTAPDIRDESIAIQRGFSAHIAVHVLDPETLAYGLHDSPVGMLAWLLERWRKLKRHRLDAIKVFVRVVEAGSFSAVAREMNITQSAISKYLAALEQQRDSNRPPGSKSASVGERKFAEVLES